jgi:hypothetical protein
MISRQYQIGGIHDAGRCLALAAVDRYKRAAGMFDGIGHLRREGGKFIGHAHQRRRIERACHLVERAGARIAIG